MYKKGGGYLSPQTTMIKNIISIIIIKVDVGVRIPILLLLDSLLLGVVLNEPPDIGKTRDSVMDTFISRQTRFDINIEH